MFPLFLSLELGRRKAILLKTIGEVMANRGMNRCPLYLMHYCCCCAFTTIYIGFCVVGYCNAISIREQGHCVASHKITYLSIAHEIKSNLSRYKAYWFLGKWALNIYYYHYYYLSKSAAIGCTCYLFARLHHIFCSYLSPCTQHLYL
jgi:hypothetical protein